jgi:hypothetical protein
VSCPRRTPAAQPPPKPEGKATRRGAGLAIAAAALLAGGLAFIGIAGTQISWIEREAAAPSRSLGLFTSLPILWRETEDIADLLKTDAPPHWAVAALARQGMVIPLDTLGGNLSRIDVLVMAQPRALSPPENVALDAWVRRGERVLLFADPMLTEDSAFAPGDRRRPQDIAMLSPILGRWGLRLEFDEGQPPGPREGKTSWGTIPVDLAGRFAALSNRSPCRIEADGLVAECRVGRGRVLAIADAALLGIAPTGQDRAARETLLAEVIALTARTE